MRTGISQTILVVALPFGERLEAADVAAAIGAGLQEGGLPQPDLCPLEDLPADFDVRLKAARAVVIASPRLDEDTLLGSLPFEIATRARQSGVPCYAIARDSALDRFDARILDLQLVLQARTPRAMRHAGLKLARAI